MIRLSKPFIEEEEIDAVSEVLKSGNLIQGARVKEFEAAIQSYSGAKFAVAVSNCTAALHLSLLSLNVQADDLVLVSSFSWPSTANVICLCGAHPVFIDINPRTFNMDANSLRRTLTSLMSNNSISKKVKAIIPVHTFGQMADMINIMDVAKNFGVPVIEDAACALGAEYRNKKAGRYGEIGCFSFHPRKAITTGEGGMVVTDNETIYRYIRALRNHGLDSLSLTPKFIIPGYNYRLSDIHAALGTIQMSKIDTLIEKKVQQAKIYNNEFQNSSIRSPYTDEDAKHVFQSYVVKLDQDMATERTSIIRKLSDSGIQTTIGTYHMPMLEYFRIRYNHTPDTCPESFKVEQSLVSLPLHHELTTEEQATVAESLKALCQ